MAMIRSQMYGHCTRYDVYNDTDADQEAQASLFSYGVRYVDSLYFGFTA